MKPAFTSALVALTTMSMWPALVVEQTCAPGVPVAFVGADVLTMIDSALLRRQTVLVRDGRITAMGSVQVPPDACRIDATGQVLMPGLSDMHAHMTRSSIPLFLANGVTLVREMNGSPAHIELRDQIATGQVVGPRLVVASPLLTGIPLRVRHRLIVSEQDAYEAAHEAKDAGYQFLKIYDDLSPEAYEALEAAGRTLGLPLDGHVPASVGLKRVIAAGQAIQHTDKVAFALAGHNPDSARLPEARALFAGKGVWLTPTLASLRALDGAGTSEYAAAFERPEMAYVDSTTLAWWSTLRRGDRRPVRLSPYYHFQTALLKTLRDSDTRFLLGTDAPNPLMVLGFSVHDELETLVRDAGFTRWEALVAATRNPAMFLGDSTGGIIRVGARADLILLRGNPLKDLATLRAPVGVMAAGWWLDRVRLDEMLAEAKAR
ncbi:MAG: amidohydrolase family protein [Gemmatimonadaceae bacterium]|nr:amidohydrolase family protein [Gemmatimonadaceae bacterium]